MLPLMLAGLLASAPTSQTIALAADPAPLHGTMLSPDTPMRAVAIIIAGSGPTDRDGDSRLRVSAATYRLLAEALAEKSIATLRYDKRGIGESAAAAPVEADLRFGAYVADAQAWAAEAAERAHMPCAWLIGHSEGALIALAAAGSADAKVCGLVLLAGAGRPAGAVIREQLSSLPDPLKTQAFGILTELENGRQVADVPAPLLPLFHSSVQPYLISWLSLDPAALAASYSGPVLIGQGTTDLQVSIADAEALKAAQQRAVLRSFEGVNHVLKIAPADRAANLATYGTPDLPLAPGVAETVADFILDRSPTP